VLAVFHTLFNLAGLLLMWPLTRPLVRWLEHRFAQAPQPDRPCYLDATLLAVPSLALRGVVLEIAALSARAFALARTVMDMSGTASAPLSTAERDAVIAIGGEVRGFMGQLASGDLPPSLAASMADMLRATQHVEEVAILAAQLKPPSLPMALDGEAEALIDAVRDALAPVPEGSGDRQVIMEAVESRLAMLAQAYQPAKARLLAETVAGRLKPAAMDEALEQVQLLRRIGEAALKAQRRFLPWVAQAAGAPLPAQPLGRL